MPDEEISSPLRDFISTYITSVAQLEILLLLKTNPSQFWPPENLAREFRIDPKAAADQLAILHQHGLLEKDPAHPASFRYAPSTSPQDEAVTALAQAYLLRRVTIISLIFAAPRPARDIQHFSDAFRFRRDDPHGS